jgi:hypothetical protein
MKVMGDVTITPELLSKMEVAKGLQMQMFMLAQEYSLSADHPIIQDIGNAYFEAFEDLADELEKINEHNPKN